MITLANADTYVARILGGSGDTGIKAQARDALKAAYNELLHRNNWSWLGVDTSQSFTVVNCAHNNDPTVTTTTANGFVGVLAGMTVTGDNIPADTTVSSVTSHTELELSASATGGDLSAETLTFGGTIPIVDGTADYQLRQQFWKPLSCRLMSTRFAPLQFMQIQDWDAVSHDQSTEGTVVAYTIWNGEQFDAETNPDTYIKFIRVPGAADVCLLRYWRKPNFSGTYVDVPDEFLYVFMDFARLHLLRSKDAGSNRIPIITRDIEQRIARAISADRDVGGDDQFDHFKTPNELGVQMPGDFHPHGDIVWRSRF
jgi:hypothetical protein